MDARYSLSYPFKPNGGSNPRTAYGSAALTVPSKVREAVQGLQKESELNFRLEAENADATNRLYIQGSFFRRQLLAVIHSFHLFHFVKN